MALTITGGTGTNSTSSTASLATAAITASVGDLVFILTAADNAGASGVSAVSSITDAAGNIWTRAFADVNQTAGAANDGTTLSVWWSILSVALAAATVTFNYSPNVTSKVTHFARVQPSAGNQVKFTSAGAGATGNGTSHSITAAGVVSGQTIFGFTALENDAQPGADTDTTNGSWNGGVGTIADAGPSTSSQSCRIQWKTTTGTGDQTFNTSSGGALDYAVNYVILEEVPAAAVTLATAGSLELAGEVPTWSMEGGASIVLDIEGSLELAGSAPTVLTPVTVTLAAAGALELAGETPSWATSDNKKVTVRVAGRMVLRGYAPTVTPNNVRWPAQLPVPLLATHAFKPQAQILRTEMEQGAARQRRISRVTPHEVPFSLVCDQTQMMFAEAWFDHIADYGGEYFSIDLMTATGYRTHTVRLMGELDYKQIRRDRWLVTGTFDMQERPMLSEAQLDALIGEDS